MEPNEKLIIVEAKTVLVQEIMDNKAIKKTLTISKWLSDTAEEHKINYSQTLQNGIKHHLGTKYVHYSEKLKLK